MSSSAKRPCPMGRSSDATSGAGMTRSRVSSTRTTDMSCCVTGSSWRRSESCDPLPCGSTARTRSRRSTTRLAWWSSRPVSGFTARACASRGPHRHDHGSQEERHMIPVRAAVHNNAVWCDAVCRALGCETAMLDGHVGQAGVASPPYYSNAVTLDAGCHPNPGRPGPLDAGGLPPPALGHQGRIPRPRSGAAGVRGPVRGTVGRPGR